MARKTQRSNEPLKRAHWKSARTERRGRFAHGWWFAQDEDLQFRRPKWWTRNGHGRSLIGSEGNKTDIGYFTADKSRLRWQLKHKKVPQKRADQIRRRLGIKS
ncbi:MAG: hypothetical protein ACYDCK_00180 [Thermoplasmatota archaeon]